MIGAAILWEWVDRPWRKNKPEPVEVEAAVGAGRDAVHPANPRAPHPFPGSVGGDEFAGGELVGVAAVGGDEFVVAAEFDDAAAVDEGDPVG